MMQFMKQLLNGKTLNQYRLIPSLMSTLILSLKVEYLRLM